MNAWRSLSLVSAGQVDKNMMYELMETADRFRNGGGHSLPPGRRAGLLFFEPSTRTYQSFWAACDKLGLGVGGFSGTEGTSVMKGETLQDTVITMAQYCDLLVIRHPKIGSAQEAADCASVPVINAGDGAGEHPTQALLDIYTIQRELGKLDEITITLCGDLKNGRTTHSLIQLFSHFNLNLMLVSPPELRMPEEVKRIFRRSTISVIDDLEYALACSEVIYMTRVQRERFEDEAEYNRLKGSYRLDSALIKKTNPDITVMHPLPRVGEIADDVDDLPGAAYFRQAENGMWLRMALLECILGTA